MAAMDTFGPFDSGAGANVMEATWRDMMRRVRGETLGRSGVIRDVLNTMEVYADDSGMQVKVKTGEVWIEGHWGRVSAEKTLPVAAADPTFARKDRVVARADFVNNSVDVEVLTGTPSGSPAIPGLTQDASKWEQSLAIVDIPALDTSIAASQVTNARQYLDLPHVIKRLSSSVTVNNSTTFVDVTELTFPVSPNRFYAIDGFLVYDSNTTADAKIQLVVPTGATARITGAALADTATGAVGDLHALAPAQSTAYNMGGAGSGTIVAAVLAGRLITSDTAGDLKLQFAQRVANASDSILLLGSWWRITPVT